MVPDITAIEIPLCGEPVTERSLYFRQRGMADWSGPDIRLCGRPAKFIAEGNPVCGTHVHKYEIFPGEGQ